jgi:XTP/dITP diphosphohydrolase
LAGRRGGGKGRGGEIWILADDSGLVVDALDGRPGVYSSRYSGEPVDYARNNKKLLGELKGVPWERRTAHFICSMVLIDPFGREYEIEGRVDGYITEGESAGKEGFGYDPVFYVPEYKCTIAEIPLSGKNKISHRGRAAKQALEILVEFSNKTCS